ncbi:hypothetical protein IJ182_00645 [bacterium]|nr:hypothetical protein [bacterium]
MAYYDENSVKKNKKGWSLITESTTELETIDLTNFLPENMKGVNIVANSTYSADYNTITSSYFNDTITAKNGKYNITLKGYGTKKVTTGNFENKYTFENYGKSTINAGDKKDTYIIKYGNSTIVDKGGDNEYKIYDNTTNKITNKGGLNTYTIYGGKNTIVDYGTVNYYIEKGENNIKVKSGADKTNYFKLDTIWQSNFITSGASSDIYDLYVGGGAYANIKSGAGKDYINIYDTHYSDKPTLDIDTGAGDDEVVIDLKYADHASTNINNIKTSKGSDKVTIKAGALNTINTGSGKDTIIISGGLQNYINGGKDNDIITVGGGNSTIQGGNDTITVIAGNTTINANSDTIDLSGGNNTVNAKAGKNTINVLDCSGDTPHIINLLKGTNTVNVTGGIESDWVRSEINIIAGKNTINIGGYSTNGITSTTKSAKKITIKDNAYCSVQLGAGADTITNSSIVNETNSMYSGAGNDKFYISNGKTKRAYGEKGNDYFEIISGSLHYAYGEEGNDTFNVKAGSGHKLYGADGKDTFNINGGSVIWAYGDEGDDIYNINLTEYGQSAILSDSAGNNKINIGKNYKGIIAVNDFNGANDTLSFDKSYKLTTSNNINSDGTLNTSDSNVTIYSNYTKSTGAFNTVDIQFITNLKDELQNNKIDQRFVAADSTIEKYSFGGKNYTLNLDNLKQDLAAWFSADGHTGYTDSASVFTGGDANDIQSLMAVYTKDTANCFVKA